MTNAEFQPQPMQLRFSVDEYHELIRLGMLKDYEKAEIIKGRLIKKITVGDLHAAVVNRLTRFLVRNLSDNILVGIQNPIRISDSDEPEPDVVLADLTKYNGQRHPRPAEILLLMEVSDSTLKYDRDVKLPLYAEAEIGEVWIINLRSNIVEVHKKPQFGVYQFVEIYKRGEIVQSAVIPELSVATNLIIGE